MKKIYSFIALLIVSQLSFAQEHNVYVENIINAVSMDSLIVQMRNLSGEDPVIINGEETIIEHRVSNWGNNLSAEYIYETLASYGLETEKDVYSLGGINVIAKQSGTLYPDEHYMICAHYDAVDYYCADDNASGVAAVIEAARIFSELEFEYSVIYALWDEEEIGLIGSADYAAEAAANGDIIHGVINMDMISWDGDGDMLAEIHTSYEANSNLLADYIEAVDNLYEIGVTTNIYNPGASSTDHSSFWNNGYAAVAVSEEYFGGDFNPYYHTAQDRIAVLHMDYFFEMSKLCIGTIAQQAEIDINVGTEIFPDNSISELRLFPNPASDQAQLKLITGSDQNIQISLVNSLGQEITGIYNSFMYRGNHQIQIPLGSLEPGIYFLKVETGSTTKTKKLLVN